MTVSETSPGGARSTTDSARRRRRLSGSPVPGKQREALERTLRAGEGQLGEVHAALVELCRTMADQIDRADDRGPSSHVSAAYLSALKDLHRAIGDEKKESTGGNLARLRSVSTTSKAKASRR